jgi:hypothetical protein
LLPEKKSSVSEMADTVSTIGAVTLVTMVGVLIILGLFKNFIGWDLTRNFEPFLGNLASSIFFTVSYPDYCGNPGESRPVVDEV